jgi:hypothetical protein
MHVKLWVYKWVYHECLYQDDPFWPENERRVWRKNWLFKAHLIHWNISKFISSLKKNSSFACFFILYSACFLFCLGSFNVSFSQHTRLQEIIHRNMHWFQIRTCCIGKLFYIFLIYFFSTRFLFYWIIDEKIHLSISSFLLFCQFGF